MYSNCSTAQGALDWAPKFKSSKAGINDCYEKVVSGEEAKFQYYQILR